MTLSSGAKRETESQKRVPREQYKKGEVTLIAEGLLHYSSALFNDLTRHNM